jgi:dynein heavy chain
LQLKPLSKLNGGPNSAKSGGLRNIHQSPITGLLRDILIPHSRHNGGDEKGSAHPRNDTNEDQIPSSNTAVSRTNISMVKYEKNLGLVTGEHAITFFARNGSQAPVKFFYCNAAVKESDSYRPNFRPYDLIIVSRKEVDSEYFTISASGVVHVKPNRPSEFVSLAEWMHHSNAFNAIRSIRFFKNYLICKAFQLWQRNVRYRKYCKQRDKLFHKLYLARTSFCGPLIEINKLFHEMHEVDVCVLKLDDKKAEDFDAIQREKRTEAAKKFESVIDKLEGKVETVCRSVKERLRSYKGKDNDDTTNSRFAQHLLGGNGRVKSMHAVKLEKAERKRKLQHAKDEKEMLGSFVRLIDYMETNHLVSIATNSVSAWHHDLLNLKRYMFLTKVQFVPQRLRCTPDDEHILKIVHDMIEGIISVMDTVERIVFMSKFKTHMKEQIPKEHQAQVSKIIHTDRGFGLLYHRIRKKIKDDYVLLQHRVSEDLEKHRQVFDFGERWNFEDYCSRNSDINVIQVDMVQQEQWRIELKKLKIEAFGGQSFVAPLQEINDLLLGVTQRALEGMQRNLQNVFHRFVIEVKTEYETTNSKLEESYQSLSGFAGFIKYTTEVKACQSQQEDRYLQVTKMHNIMKEQKDPFTNSKVQIDPADDVAFEDLDHEHKKFNSVMENAELLIKKNVEDKAQEVTLLVNALKKDTEAEEASLHQGIFIENVQGKDKTKEVLKALDAVKASLDAKVVQSNLYSEWLERFEREPSENVSLKSAMAAYEKKRQFWELYNNWKEKQREWNQSDFSALDHKKMDDEVNEFFSTAFELNKFYKGIAVTAKLKSDIFEFQQIMPLILLLGSKAIKPAHWRLLFASITPPQPFVANEKIKLSKLITMSAFKFKQKIREIAGQAQGEFLLAEALEKIQNTWSVEEFKFSQYPRSPDVSVIGEIEDTMQKLEENQVALNNMLASPYVAPELKNVELWANTLRFMSETLEEWINCQKNWLYLEPIFTSPDMQRQLPAETASFLDVDRFWRDLMRKTALTKNVKNSMANQSIKANLQKSNKELDRIQKLLEKYLETKRAAFPRFYFLSDEELLAILSQARSPQAVQPHLIKCFDNIASLVFTNVPNSTEVTAMISCEGEVANFARSVMTVGNTETWLKDIEYIMRMSVKSYLKSSLGAYPQGKADRADWIKAWPAQTVLTISAVYWTFGATEALLKIENNSDPQALTKFLVFSREQIAKLVDMVRGSLAKQERLLCGSLMIMDIHARDVISDMVEIKCSKRSDYSWIKQLRYYWEENEHPDPSMVQEDESMKVPGLPEHEDCIARQTNARFDYRYEYLGNPTRLVITPLTDKCYLTLTTAMSLHFGGAPAGPAGTGKTETVKDLGKSLANQVVVFNCSDGLKVKIITQFFCGLASAGAWACFDEFNRIDIEVLSVIAQQIMTIQQAIIQQKSPFNFCGRMLPLDSHFGVFITMNPGYAGRTELPDNLKALFRPVAMMVPDYGLIAQIILFSEGFQDATSLSKKMAQMYKLASEQLSKQDHYDFGMRAVKSVLVMAGAMKRRDPDLPENILLIRALRDSNIPKFLAHDVPLFLGIISDLFPGVEVPTQNRQVLIEAIDHQMISMNLQKVPAMITKIIQLRETMEVRHGVMVVGETMAGKSTVIKILEKALTQLHQQGVSEYKNVQFTCLNPKSISMDELFGYTKLSNEWQDGLVAFIIRQAAKDTTGSAKWVCFDGPVDALWIENMNTVLDDNKMLCLANAERIKLPVGTTMMFETQDLSVASPATVSRCGMVFMEPKGLGWLPILESWQKDFQPVLGLELMDYVVDILKKYIQPLVDFIYGNCQMLIPAVPGNLMVSCLKLFEALILPLKERLAAGAGDDEDRNQERKHTNGDDFTHLVDMCLLFSIIWSFGGNIADDNVTKFNGFIRDNFGTVLKGLPHRGDVFDYCIDETVGEFVTWNKNLVDFTYNPATPFFNILVPTTDTTKYTFLLDVLFRQNRNVLLMGSTGVGKTVVVQDYLRKVSDGGGPFVPAAITFSAQTSANNMQDCLEIKMEKKFKTLLGAPVGKRVVIFVDDMNMPLKEKYGAQPPLELFRQCLDQKGFYDRKELFFRRIQDVIFVAACAEPGGGRNVMTPRVTRHFHMLWQPQLSETSMNRIFSLILGGYLSNLCRDWKEDVRSFADKVVQSTVTRYFTIKAKMLPIPSKSHYTFNLRDLGKVIQGITQVDDQNHLKTSETLLKLWTHEASRVFRDRLVDDKDGSWYDLRWSEMLRESFQCNWDSKYVNSILFGDFLDESKSYQDISERSHEIPSRLNTSLRDINATNGRIGDLVFFRDAIFHFSRISRILRNPRGNALLVGVGGSGRKSLAKLAIFINGFKMKTIEITRAYKFKEWHEDLKSICLVAGVKRNTIVFLISDTQLVMPIMLEDINNLLNAGEVPNLFEHDEVDKICSDLRDLAYFRENKINLTKENIMEYFVQQVRENLHVVLCMSPVGDGFRSRCRQYPSLVNCCTIDWYSLWPEDALLVVADRFLSDESLGIKKYQEALGRICVNIHMSVMESTKLFFAQLRRYNYATPTSYLELIKLFKVLLTEQQDIVSTKLSRYRNGLEMLRTTNDKVDKLKEKLIKWQPELKKQGEELAITLVDLERDKKDANAKAEVCGREAKETAAIMAEVQAIKDDCDASLAISKPALEKAMKKVAEISANDITMMKNYAQPPDAVKQVMAAVCILFGEKNTDWKTSLGLLKDLKFRDKCINYINERVLDAKTIKKIQPYIEDKEFDPEIITRSSVPAGGLCLWVHAMNTYYKAKKEIEPKEKSLVTATEKLNETQKSLNIKQKALKEVEDKVARLEREFNEKNDKLAETKANVLKSTLQLERAEKLLGGLGSEEARWKVSAAQLAIDLENLVGNMMLSAGQVAYSAPFTSHFRKDMVLQWNKYCLDLKVPVDMKFDLVRILGDPVVIRQWNIFGLPADNYSLENGIITHRGTRWPLMIDPQEQGNRWIKQLHKKRNVAVCKFSDATYLKTIDGALRFGQPLLLESVGEVLEPPIEPVLLKQLFIAGGQLNIRFDEKDVPYSDDFRFFITTKLANPHYLPEVFVKVTIINFTVTQEGLTDQLLVVVCGMERADLEEKNDRLVVSIAKDQQELNDMEIKILALLASSNPDEILDDEKLIEALAASKKTSIKVSERMADAEKVVKTIQVVREEYRVVAVRASILYFVVADLARIDPMYQYSLLYYTNLFRGRIRETPKAELRERLQILLDDLNLSMYLTICRGLFEKDKLLFSFLMTIQIARNAGTVPNDEWAAFLKGADGSRLANLSSNPVSSWLPDSTWMNLHASLPAVAEVTKDLADAKKATVWQRWYAAFGDAPTGAPVPSIFTGTIFQQLLLRNVFLRQCTIFAIQDYIAQAMGAEFVKSPPFDLEAVYQASSPNTPIIFVLSPGANPMEYILKLARTKGQEEKLHQISLGQGQGPLAEELMTNGRRDGDWVVLENCHLSTSWMPQLEQILDQTSQQEVHDGYRLFLTSMPSAAFPVAILQSGIKIVNEPPRGLANNLRGTFLDISQDYYDSCSKSHAFKKLFFGLAFFHAAIQERRRFGPIGWNIPYEWMNSDLIVSKMQLKLYLDETDHVPYQTLRELIGEVNYAGRVTDDKDQNCITSMLKQCINENVLTDGYCFTTSNDYQAPSSDAKITDVLKLIESLPIDTPGTFGLHSNADITFQLNETNLILNKLISIQPRTAVAAGGKSSDDTIKELAQSFIAKLPPKLDTKTAHPSTFAGIFDGTNTLGVFFGQELDRFNKLLSVIRKVLIDLQDAIAGTVVMSQDLDNVYNKLLINQVPEKFEENAWPSLKNMQDWFDDVCLRVQMMREWLVGGAPNCFWISGFFFPQGFCTSVLQKYARATSISIDTLRFRSHVMPTRVPEELKHLEKGAYIRGMYLQGGGWDMEGKTMCESTPGELFQLLPIVWMEPETIDQPLPQKSYNCPSYKTSLRAGTLSTTGHSTNFVQYIQLPTKNHSADHWVRRGCALLLTLDSTT